MIPSPSTPPGLRSLASCGGCAAKADPALVSLLVAVAGGRRQSNPDLLVGLDAADDGAVYRLDDERALVATVDFFPPLVDNPEDYGEIAAANAVSDIYAMGASVALALVISGFPAQVSHDVVTAATRAAARVVEDCGGQVVGGHSIRCSEPVFGLAVLGFVHPQKVWRKGGAQPGDALMLSKSLGTGVLLSAGDSEGVATAVRSMRETNATAARVLAQRAGGPHAVTDVTGYGLAGHAWEMAGCSGTALRIEARALPVLTDALEALERGFRTSADVTTRRALDARVHIAPEVTAELTGLLFDPQTSGGLLAAVPAVHVPELVKWGFVEIGSVQSGPSIVEVVA